MARPPRIEYYGAFYHVIVRGNRKQNIFRADGDRVEFLNRLQYYKRERPFVLYAYVLMSNHVHLLIETGTIPLSRIMQPLNFTYARYFNRKYGEVGHLFQGRYKAILCDRDEYLLALIRYVHLNPVRAGLAASPEEYEWSSHRHYLQGGSALIDTGPILRMFAEKPAKARALYREFVNEDIGKGKDESFYRAVEQQVLGDETFIEKVQKKVEREIEVAGKIELKDVLQTVLEVTGIEKKALQSMARTGEIVRARELLSAVWKEGGGKLVELKPVLRRDLSVISRLARRGEERKKEMRQILEHLSATLQA